MYGNQIYDDKTNQIILMHVIRYIENSQRVDEPLLICLLTDLLVFLYFTTHKM